MNKSDGETREISSIKESIARGSLVLGQIASDKQKTLKIIANAFADLARGKGAETFVDMYDTLAEEGQLDVEFPRSHKRNFFFQEMESHINSSIKDEELLHQKIDLFMAIASKKYSDHSFDEVKEIWIIVSHLQLKDIKVLAAAYTDSNIESDQGESLGTWQKRMAQESGLGFREFIEDSTSRLSAQRLLNDNLQKPVNRLSPLGKCVAEYLVEGNRLRSIYEGS